MGDEIQPTVWLVKFSPEVEALVIYLTNKECNLKKSDLEISGLLLIFLLFEGIRSLVNKKGYI